LDALFERTVRFAQVDLTAATPLSESAYHPNANVGGEARLRITLADDVVRWK
jgi:hypothetical protein